MEKRRKVKRGSYDILAWPREWLEDFQEACALHKIEFMVTVFLEKDVPVIAPYVSRFKVASLESEDRELIACMMVFKKEVIVSHGASSGGLLPRVKNLHCTAAYPASAETLNLLAISSGYDGYSDHSRNVLTGALAVACGAVIVETHFRLGKTPVMNHEYRHSLDPNRLLEYIANIRMAESMLGNGKKKVERSERWALKYKVKA
jgi:sialic acid synthase SpsE